MKLTENCNGCRYEKGDIRGTPCEFCTRVTRSDNFELKKSAFGDTAWAGVGYADKGIQAVVEKGRKEGWNAAIDAVLRLNIFSKMGENSWWFDKEVERLKELKEP